MSVIEREWTHAGLTCAVVMHGAPGHRCGYVRVSREHPLFRRHHAELVIDVHGGLSFSGETLGLPGFDVKPSSEGGWWFGFHCAHPADAMIDPNLDPTQLPVEALENWNLYRRVSRMIKGHYWTQKEVEVQTEYMAAQLAAIEQ
jgi:hypothetical protein